MNSRITTSLAASALALAMGAAWAQAGGGAAGGSTGTGTGAGAGAGSTTAPATQAGTGTRNAPKPAAKLARADRKFIEEAAASGMFEVQAAQLAATKATDPAVKDYATRLADQHATANSELMQLANSLGLELPPAPKRAMRNEIEKLGKRTGADFDREFVREVGVKEHEKDVKTFQKAAKDVKEPQLKVWIDKTLPVLQQHLSMAQNLPQAGGKAAEATRSGQRSTTGSTSGTTGTSGASGTTSGPAGTGGSSGANKSGS